jgi:hypothetical protein
LNTALETGKGVDVGEAFEAVYTGQRVPEEVGGAP